MVIQTPEQATTMTVASCPSCTHAARLHSREGCTASRCDCRWKRDQIDRFLTKQKN